jgi:hypothetical protein
MIMHSSRPRAHIGHTAGLVASYGSDWEVPKHKRIVLRKYEYELEQNKIKCDKLVYGRSKNDKLELVVDVSEE